MLATLVHAMTPSWQAFIYALALIVLIVAAVKKWAPTVKAKTELVALGLALFVLVAFWQALAAS